jgi:hypothetical protein
MEYLELLEAKETIIKNQHYLCEVGRQLGKVSKEKIYTMSMLTHVTDMGTHQNYVTSLILDETDEDSTIHSLSAFVQVIDYNGCLDLLKLMIKDYEEDKNKNK